MVILISVSYTHLDVYKRQPNVEDIEIEFNDSETEFLRTVINIMDQKHVITDNILDFVELIQN